ncbi:hypothetical protein HOK51_09960 [Candidatus Woesearchaeota archaeon]|jgi:hypothetical protein|nr:hypothetical protein [Candidatus Woesearchaeota archaeon]MBT6520148.1 hypothetical protein [Candidatus Woesearchaeota archaeon]MBT7366753.1 hypothetical protein [Candidatus Woesearchaeota archaeon]
MLKDSKLNNANIIKPVDVYVAPDSLNYWWGIHGWQETNWEDIVVYFKNVDGNLDFFSTDILTKNYFNVNQKNKDLAEGVLSEANMFNKSLDQLLSCNKILYAYCYDDLEDEDFYQVDFDAPKNELGIKPRYISMFHPADNINFSVVNECVSKYCKDYFNLPFTKVRYFKKPKKTHMRKEYNKYLNELKTWKENAKKGIKLKLMLIPGAINDIYGAGFVESIEEEARCKIEYGFRKDGATYVKFTDGREKMVHAPKLKIVE